jgi:cyclohexyl-isocyanide hydratase
VPGGLGACALARDPGVAAYLAAFPTNRVIASVCTGALLLGAAGRLRGKRATTHARHLVDLEPFGAHAVSERVVDEGQVVTAGGVTAGIELGLHLVLRLAGEEVARAIASQMEAQGAFAAG